MSEERIPFRFERPLVDELRWVLERFCALSMAYGDEHNTRFEHYAEDEAERQRARLAIARAMAAVTPVTPPVIPVFPSLGDAFIAMANRPGLHTVSIQGHITNIKVGEKQPIPAQEQGDG